MSHYLTKIERMIERLKEVHYDIEIKVSETQAFKDMVEAEERERKVNNENSQLKSENRKLKAENERLTGRLLLSTPLEHLEDFMGDMEMTKKINKLTLWDKV